MYTSYIHLPLYTQQLAFMVENAVCDCSVSQSFDTFTVCALSPLMSNIFTVGPRQPSSTICLITLSGTSTSCNCAFSHADSSLMWLFVGLQLIYQIKVKHILLRYALLLFKCETPVINPFS